MVLFKIYVTNLLLNSPAGLERLITRYTSVRIAAMSKLCNCAGNHTANVHMLQKLGRAFDQLTVNFIGSSL